MTYPARGTGDQHVAAHEHAAQAQRTKGREAGDGERGGFGEFDVLGEPAGT